MTERKPDFLVRTIKEVNGKQQWTSIGTGFANESGTITHSCPPCLKETYSYPCPT